MDGITLCVDVSMATVAQMEQFLLYPGFKVVGPERFSVYHEWYGSARSVIDVGDYWCEGGATPCSSWERGIRCDLRRRPDPDEHDTVYHLDRYRSPLDLEMML